MALGRPAVTVSKIAVTDLSPVMDTRQLRLPLQSPCQPTNTEPGDGVASSLTRLRVGYSLVQFASQASALPSYRKETLPDPVPEFS
jgi:hypothetical protein